MAMKMKKYEELELRDDFMFSRIMSNPKFVKPLLETILGVKIRKIVYPQTQKTIDLSLQAKGIRLDVYVEDDQNTVFNLEMQTSDGANLPKRMRYYQGMIDLNILEKGENYKNLKKSFVIFICTFDLFGLGRHVYTFENRCIEDLELPLGDDTTKIILNTKGTLDDVSPEMKKLLNYIDGEAPSDEFTEELEQAVKKVRDNEKWRLDYMTLQMSYQEKFEQGLEQGLERGLERGIEQGISGTIKILAGLDYSDEQIAEQLIKQFAIDEEQAYKYILIAKK